jgi:hypothetical protein
MPGETTMTTEEVKVNIKSMILYLLKCYPQCAEEGTEDHENFMDDMSDMFIAKTIGIKTVGPLKTKQPDL